jgi:hypothetical protein
MPPNLPRHSISNGFCCCFSPEEKLFSITSEGVEIAERSLEAFVTFILLNKRKPVSETEKASPTPLNPFFVNIKIFSLSYRKTYFFAYGLVRKEQSFDAKNQLYDSKIVENLKSEIL